MTTAPAYLCYVDHVTYKGFAVVVPCPAGVNLETVALHRAASDMYQELQGVLHFLAEPDFVTTIDQGIVNEWIEHIRALLARIDGKE